MAVKKNPTFILFAVLIVLVVVYLVWQNPFSPAQNQAQEEALITIDLQELTKIEIISPKKTVILEKTDQWKVASEDNFPANSSLIYDLIDNLEKAKTGQVVSDNLDKLEKFNLTEDKATKIKLTDSTNASEEILIGELGGAAFTNTYVKKADSNNILIVPINLTFKINQPDWKQPAPEENEDTSEEAAADSADPLDTYKE